VLLYCTSAVNCVWNGNASSSRTDIIFENGLLYRMSNTLQNTWCLQRKKVTTSLIMYKYLRKITLDLPHGVTATAVDQFFGDRSSRPGYQVHAEQRRDIVCRTFDFRSGSWNIYNDEVRLSGCRTDKRITDLPLSFFSERQKAARKRIIHDRLEKCTCLSSKETQGKLQALV